MAGLLRGHMSRVGLPQAAPPSARRPVSCLGPVVLSCLVLLGCTDAGNAPAALGDSLSATQASLRAIRGEPAPSSRTAAAQAAAAPLPAPRLGSGGVAPTTVSALLHGTAEAVRGALGEPSLRRPEGEAEVWLYEAPQCRLDIVLYRDGGVLRVALAEARSLGLERQTEAACLRDIAGGRAAPPPLLPRA